MCRSASVGMKAELSAGLELSLRSLAAEGWSAFSVVVLAGKSNASFCPHPPELLSCVKTGASPHYAVCSPCAGRKLWTALGAPLPTLLL